MCETSASRRLSRIESEKSRPLINIYISLLIDFSPLIWESEDNGILLLTPTKQLELASRRNDISELGRNLDETQMKNLNYSQ